MIEQNNYRESIQSVSDEVPRPLWSVMIPTYNCANYLRDTLESILKQDPGRDIMQIEVIDDHSIDDNPEAIVRELAGDRVSFYRQPQNVGYIKNFNTCLQRSRGELIHLLHGDDCVREGFYLKMQQGFNEKPEIGAAFSRYISMDQNGHWQWLSQLEQSSSGVLDHWLDQIAIINRIFPPSIVVRRNVYEKLGGYDSRISCCGEDWEMWVRIAANYPIWYEVEPLALYRSHSSSLTGRCARSGQNVRDLRQIIEIIQSCLPLTKATYLSQKARENCAIYAIKSITPKFVAMGDWDAVKIQIQEALRCSCSLKVLQELALMIVRTGKNWNKRLIKGKNAVST